jgi:hypothetical protein
VITGGWLDSAGEEGGFGTASFFSSITGDGAEAVGCVFSSIGTAWELAASLGLASSSAFFFFITGFFTRPNLSASASCAFLTLIFKFLANA